MFISLRRAKDLGGPYNCRNTEAGPLDPASHPFPQSMQSKYGPQRGSPLINRAVTASAPISPGS